MPDATMADHYAALNLPPGADIIGIENAYARLSSELAVQTWVDETAAAELLRINQAYEVLSKPTLRREYDRSFLAGERQHAERQAEAAARRRNLVRWGLRGMLVASLFGEAAVLFVVYA